MRAACQSHLVFAGGLTRPTGDLGLQLIRMIRPRRNQVAPYVCLSIVPVPGAYRGSADESARTPTPFANCSDTVDVPMFQRSSAAVIVTCNETDARIAAEFLQDSDIAARTCATLGELCRLPLVHCAIPFRVVTDEHFYQVR